MSRPFRIVVLASGNGTNLQAILDRLHGRGEVEVVGVGSDRPGARGARARPRPPASRPPSSRATDYPDRAARDAAIGDWIEGLGADLVVLAGYMQLLGGAFVVRFRHRVVNVHPALLPAFPGLDAIGQALDGGCRDDRRHRPLRRRGSRHRAADPPARGAGAAGRDRAELEEAVHAVEHELYPEAIRMIARGRVRIDDADPRVVVIDE